MSDRDPYTDRKLTVSDRHQVFGKMTGTAILDDGTYHYCLSVLRDAARTIL